LAPDDVVLLGEMARTMAAGGQHEAAIGDITRLLDAHPSQDPQRADLLRVRAELRLGMEDLSAAIADLEEAHAIVKEAVTPALIDALERFKTAAFTRGDSDAERATVMRLVELHENSGDLLAAREALGGWVDQSPQDLEALHALLRRDQAAGRWAEAAQNCERLLETEDPAARRVTVLALADASTKAGEPERARDWLERVQRESPDDAEVRTRLRKLYEDTQALSELAALLLVEAGAAQDTTERVALYQRAARLFLQVGDPSAALGPLGQASALQPEDNQTQLLMIDLSIQLGTLEDAERTIEAAISAQRRGRSPELASLYQRKARLAAARQDREEQLKWLNQATDIDRKSSEIASELAEAAIAGENYDVAMKALRALTMMDDPKPITRALAFLRQAEIANLRGDPRRAQHWARKAKSLDANLKEADALLASLEGVEA
jgi:tetratricopeptide (TPR) repeat protein